MVTTLSGKSRSTINRMYFNLFPRHQHLLIKAKAFRLVEIRRRAPWGNGRNSLRHHGTIGGVFRIEHGNVYATGIYRHTALLRPKMPRHGCIGIGDETNLHVRERSGFNATGAAS